MSTNACLCSARLTSPSSLLCGMPVVSESLEKPRPDEYTLSSAIRSCERRADVQRAEAMCLEIFCPAPKTQHAVPKLERAMQAYVQQMSRLGVLPNHAVCSEAVCQTHDFGSWVRVA